MLKTDFRPVLNEAVPDVKQIFYYGDWNECIRLVSVLTPIFFYFFLQSFDLLLVNWLKILNSLLLFFLFFVFFY